MDFWRALEIVYRRKWLILLSVAATTLLTFGVTRLVGANWVATVRLIAPAVTPYTQAGSSSAAPDSGTVPQFGPYAKEAAANQAAVFQQIATSKEVLEAAIKTEPGVHLTQELISGISVTSVAPRIYDLQVSAPTSDESRVFANALAGSFVDKYVDINTRQYQDAVTFLSKQYADAESKLRAERQQYEAYRGEHHLAGRTGGENTLDNALARLARARTDHDMVSQQLASAQAQLAAKEQDLAKLPALIPPQAVADANPVIKQLQDSLEQADIQLAMLRTTYTDSYPAVIRAKAARDVLAGKLQQETQRLTGGAKNLRPDQLQTNPMYFATQQEVSRLNQEVAGLQAQADAANQTLADCNAQLNGLKGTDAPVAGYTGKLQELTDAGAGLAARLNAAQMALDVARQQHPLQVSDEVSDLNPPIDAAAGRTKKLLLLAALCAFLATSGIVIALDSIDRRLRSVHEAEIALPAKVLAAIPQPMGAVTYSSLARATDLHPQSLHAESYRFLGLHLLSAHAPAVRSLLVLSAKAEQGTTTALSNLAITLAQAGRRVIAVDANIRTAELHSVFEMENGLGFTELLDDPSGELLDKALRPTSVPNLWVITSGSIPSNPWKVFRSPNLMELSRRLLERADFVLYDTPSALLFTDALNLAPIVDAALLSVRALEPLTGSERRLVELLEEAGVKLLGCVLNDVPASVVEGYENYQHYYASHQNGHSAIPPAELPEGPEEEPVVVSGGGPGSKA